MDDQAVTSKELFDETDIYWAMWEALSEIHGDYGAGAAKQSLSGLFRLLFLNSYWHCCCINLHNLYFLFLFTEFRCYSCY